jgi:predicted transposase YdaD
VPSGFDAVFKEVLLQNPANLLQILNLPVGRLVTSEPTDVSASSRRADILLKVSDPDYLVQVEMQTSYDRTMPKRMLEYRVLSGLRHETLPVMESVLFLLRPQADNANLDGILESKGIRFAYHIVRLWEVAAEMVIQQPIHMMPLAPLCAVQPSDLPILLNQMQERLVAERVPLSDCREIWARTRYLLGLKMSNEQAEQLMGGIMLDLRDSTTYRATLEEGIRKGKLVGHREGKAEGKAEGGLDEARKLLIRLGERRFGGVGSDIHAQINSIDDLGRIEGLIERVLDANNWAELLG